MERIDLGGKQTLPITIFGKDLDLDMPTVADIELMQSALSKKNASSLKPVRELIEQMGMPKDVCLKMQNVHFEKLIEHIMGRKKK